RGGEAGGGGGGQRDADGGGRAAVLGAVVDPGQHDQGRFGGQAQGRRQQHGDGGNGTQPRQHANQNAEQDAEEAIEEICRRQRGGATDGEIGKHLVHAASPPAPGPDDRKRQAQGKPKHDDAEGRQCQRQRHRRRQL